MVRPGKCGVVDAVDGRGLSIPLSTWLGLAYGSAIFVILGDSSTEQCATRFHRAAVNHRNHAFKTT
jgi:hypothetical protein